MDISHEKSITILKQKDKYEKMKDNFRSENEEHATKETPIKIEK